MSHTRIRTDKKTAERLSELKSFGQSYDDVINDLIDQHDDLLGIVNETRVQDGDEKDIERLTREIVSAVERVEGVGGDEEE